MRERPNMFALVLLTSNYCLLYSEHCHHCDINYDKMVIALVVNEIGTNYESLRMSFSEVKLVFSLVNTRH